MRYFSACVIAAAFAGLSAAAQDQAPTTTPDPVLDALSPAEEPENELDALSRTPDDPFPSLEGSQRRKPVSVTIRALDKITARYTDIEATIGEPAKFGSLEILPRFCDKRPPEEFPETTAFLEIFDRDLARARASAVVEARELPTRARDRESKPTVDEPEIAPTSDYAVRDIPAVSADAIVEAPVPQAALAPAPTPSAPIDPDRIFAGWMFASSPALNPVEHPIYDVWVIDCKTVVVDK